MFDGPYHMGAWGWLPFVLGSLLWIAVVVLIVVVAVRFFRPRAGGWSGPQSPDSPEEILHRRFANGEIDVEEYERRMTALRAQRPPRP